jgi:hypothetical protein
MPTFSGAGLSPCRWPSGQRREAKNNGSLQMIWARFVASGAEQKLGGKAEAMPHTCRRSVKNAG